jgi:hypothetical protein
MSTAASAAPKKKTAKRIHASSPSDATNEADGDPKLEAPQVDAAGRASAQPSSPGVSPEGSGEKAAAAPSTSTDEPKSGVKPDEPVSEKVTERPSEKPSAAEAAAAAAVPAAKPAEVPAPVAPAPEVKASSEAAPAPATPAPAAAETKPAETKPAETKPAEADAKAPSIGEPPKLEAPLVATPKAEPVPVSVPVAAPAQPARPARFDYAMHGFVRAGYAYTMRDAGSFTVGQDSGFRLANARFGLKGGYGEHVRFDLSIDAASLLDAATNQAPLTLGFRDAVVSFHAGGGWLKVGQFKTPFNGEFQLPDDAVPFTRVSLVTDGIRSDEGRMTHGALNPDRQLGVDVGWRLGFGEAAAELEVAAVNGNGMNQGRNDNVLPAVIGRASVGWRGNVLAASGLWNERTVGRLGNQQDERDLAFDVDARLDLFGVHAYGMYVYQRTTFLTANDQAPRNSWGAVGAVSYAIPIGASHLEPAYRIALYSPTNLIPDASLLDQTFGVNFYPHAFPMRIQAGYTLRLERVSRTAPNDLAELLVQANF